LPAAEIVPTVADPPAVPFTLQVTLVFEFPVTVAVNCADPPARTFAVEGLTVTIVDPGVVGLLGFEGDVGLDPPLVPVVVAVFTMPPHAHATSARSSGSPCSTERLVEPLIERIALTHLEWFACCIIFVFRSVGALLDRGVAVGQCPQRKVFSRKNL
jgi:hypothetical protein